MTLSSGNSTGGGHKQIVSGNVLGISFSGTDQPIEEAATALNGYSWLEDGR